MLTPENVARPLDAGSDVGPDRVLPPGLLPNVRETVALELVTRFPPRSRTSTWMSGVIAAPGTVLEGGTRNPSLAADPTVIVNGVDVAPARLVALADNV